MTGCPAFLLKINDQPELVSYLLTEKGLEYDGGDRRMDQEEEDERSSDCPFECDILAGIFPQLNLPDQCYNQYDYNWTHDKNSQFDVEIREDVEVTKSTV